MEEPRCVREKIRSRVKRSYVAVSEHRGVVQGMQGGELAEGYLEVYEFEP